MLKGNKRTVNHGYSFLDHFWTYCRYFSQVDYAGERRRRGLLSPLFWGSSARGRRLDQYLFGFGKVDGFNFGSFVVAVIGALVVLFIYRKCAVNSLPFCFILVNKAAAISGSFLLQCPGQATRARLLPVGIPGNGTTST